MSEDKKSIVIAEDHTILRGGLRALLSESQLQFGVWNQEFAVHWSETFVGIKRGKNPKKLKNEISGSGGE